MTKTIDNMNIIITKEDLKNLINVLISFRESLDINISIALFRNRNSDKIPTIRLNVVSKSKNFVEFQLQSIVDSRPTGTVSNQFAIPDEYNEDSLNVLIELLDNLISHFTSYYYMDKVIKECGFDININLNVKED